MASQKGSTVKDTTGRSTGHERHTLPMPSSMSRVVPETTTLDKGVRSCAIFGGLALAALDHEAVASC